MIYIDPRAGSKELLAPLLQMKAPAMSAGLAFGDLAFVSREKQSIGIEFKTVSECVGALRSGRLIGHQLPGMLGPQGLYNQAWLLLEGDWSIDDNGIMCQRRRGGDCAPIPGKMPASEWHKRLLTLSLKHGLNIWHCRTRAMTLRWIVDTYRWYSDSASEGHDSGVAIYQQPLGIGFEAASDDQRAIAAWPGVGGKWSMVALTAFGNVERAVLATATEWASLERGGRCFGMKSAERVKQFLRGER